jgi:hypothetical protein
MVLYQSRTEFGAAEISKNTAYCDDGTVTLVKHTGKECTNGVKMRKKIHFHVATIVSKGILERQAQSVPLKFSFGQIENGFAVHDSGIID